MKRRTREGRTRDRPAEACLEARRDANLVATDAVADDVVHMQPFPFLCCTLPEVSSVQDSAESLVGGRT